MDRAGTFRDPLDVVRRGLPRMPVDKPHHPCNGHTRDLPPNAQHGSIATACHTVADARACGLRAGDDCIVPGAPAHGTQDTNIGVETG